MVDGSFFLLSGLLSYFKTWSNYFPFVTYDDYKKRVCEEDAEVKVLMQARPDLIKIPAGDTIQVLKTKDALEDSGVDVDLNLDLTPDLSQYQLVHCFNITRIDEISVQIDNAIQQGCPVALSPVYWNMEEFLAKNAQEQITWWKNGWKRRKKKKKKANIILPNSKSEMYQLKMDFKFETPYQVVYNGVDPSFYEADSREFIEEYGLRDFVLCIGRVCKRKNQLTVIEALQNSDFQMVFIGNINDPIYYKECLKAGGNRVKFIPHLPHEKLVSAYGAARVHILASWFDTPGLVNLEAGLAGCNLVVSNRGTAQEYFNDLVWYCSPDDPNTIRTSVKEAYHSPRIDDLKDHILRNFTWKQIGETTYEAYARMLNFRYISRVT